MSAYISLYHKMTEEMRVKIVELWQQEMTGGEIASQLGISRNSVIGVIYRARRNGIILREKNYKDANKRAAIKLNKIQAKQKEKESKKVFRPIKKIVEQKIVQEILEIIEPEIICEAVNMNDLTYSSCRFIVEDGNYETTKYCGRTIDRASYCKNHYAICYVAPRSAYHKSLDV